MSPAERQKGERKDVEERDFARALREAAPYLGMGMTMAGTLLALLGIGYFVDGKFGTRPLFFLVGGVLGIVASLYHFLKTVAGGTR